MTLTIDISPEEARLQAEAARCGGTPSDLLRAVLSSLIGPETENRPSWSAA